MLFKQTGNAVGQLNFAACALACFADLVKHLGSKHVSANNSKVVLMPLEASQVIGAVGGIGEIVRATFDSRDGKK